MMELCDAVCLLNHTYLRFGMKRIIEELSTLSKLPEAVTSKHFQEIPILWERYANTHLDQCEKYFI